MSNSKRSVLHDKLLEILGRYVPGSGQVYFNPPDNVRLTYPAIIYKHSGIDKRDADNRKYFRQDQYMITIIDRDPDSTIYEDVMALPLTTPPNMYTADNLCHWSITITV